MQYEWDGAKCNANKIKHGVDFSEALSFEWEKAITRQDRRFNYDEPRFVSIAPIANRLYVMVWTTRNDATRIITFRKANRREVKYYVSKI
jgi:uncharacterized DUF497 family protein